VNAAARPWRRGPLAALLALLVIAVPACASLPDSGPVQQGDPDVTEPGSIALLARLPGPDDSPEQIVDGFLRASAAGLTDDFTIAREFLTGPMRSSWDPLAQVSVYSGQPTLQQDATNDEMTVTASVSATLDEEGRFTEALAGASVQAQFGLVQDGQGRWRIGAATDGVLLSEPIFRSLFQQVPLYFVAPDGQALVSETRFFPRRTVETAAVGSLLLGPSPWLAEGVSSRFPPGTRLLVDTVTVRDGVAQVGLSGEAREASPADRGLMLAQLNETLNGLPRVQSVTVTAAGVPFDMAAARRDLVVDPSVGTSPVVLAGGFVRTVEGNDVVPWGETGSVAGVDPSNPAVPYGAGSPVVLANGTGVVTVPSEGEEPTTLLGGSTKLTAPSFDRLGWVWVAPRTNAGRVTALRLDGIRVGVGTDWLAGREIRSLRVARDGARVLILSTAGAAVVLEVAAVVRDADGAPVSLGPPLRIGQRISRASTAVWVDQQTVAALGAVGDGDGAGDTVVLAVVGGPTSSLPAVEGAVGLAAGKGDRLLYVSTGAGELFTRNGLGWTPIVQGVRDPTFPG
jgi:hypothetical protein